MGGIATHLLVYGAGLITGMYFVTQVGRGINNNIEKNLKEYEKKKAKQQKS